MLTRICFRICFLNAAFVLLVLFATAYSSAAPGDSANSLLRQATKVTTFSKNESELYTGYDWISPTEIVFQRKGGYIRRDVKTGVERPVKGFPYHDKEHWFGGNMMARFTDDGAWMLWHGPENIEEGDDGSLRVERTDGSAGFTWTAERFPELAVEETFWLADNETWACPTAWKDPHSRRRVATVIAVGSVRAPGKVRRIPFAKDLEEDWDIFAATRNSLLASPTPEERKPPAASHVQVTELVLGKKVTRGRSYVIPLSPRAHAYCEGGLSRTGLLLWSLVERGSPYTGQRPLVTVAAVSRLGSTRLRKLGRITTTTYGEEDEPQFLRWLPDGKRFSFLYRRGLYVAPVE